MADIRVSGNRLFFGGNSYRCAIGKGGFSSNKKEGDGCTPLGIFVLRECWYRADKIPAPVTALPLKPIHETDGWCDDPKSPEYNRHIKIPSLQLSPLKGERAGSSSLSLLKAKGTGSSSTSPFRGEGRGGGALLRNAKMLRGNMTEAEKLLWYHLRAHRFAEYGFRRQRPMGGKYIADFVCPKRKLVIELDGGQHADSAEDEVRDAFLASEGYRVLRFWNNDVLSNIEGVLTIIMHALTEGTPSLTLPPEGGGDKPEGGGDKKGYENLFRADDVYDLIIPLGYNDSPVIPGKGSAIFLHVAKGDYSPTEGCIALAKSDLAAILPAINSHTMIHIEE